MEGDNKVRRILIAGAGGTLGLPLARRLVAAGHTVTGITRSPAKLGLVEATGAHGLAADALDAGAMLDIALHVRPHQVVNLLTALPKSGALRAADLRATNRLRREASANLLAAAIQAGARRVVAESFVAVLGRTGPARRATEEDQAGEIRAGEPLYETIAALRELELMHREANREGRIETVVLRYGFFYGPGVPSTEAMLRNLRRGTMLTPSGAQGVASWLHIDDAAAATQLAIEHPSPARLYHVSDNQPVSVGQAIDWMCQASGSRRPWSIPAWTLRWLAPAVPDVTSRNLAVDNGKIKRELGWTPRFPSLREGLDAMHVE